MADVKKEKVFFGANEKKKYLLPDSKEQWIEYIKFTEGQRRKYEDATSRKVSFDNSRDIAEIETAMGSDRKALFDTAVTGYNLLVAGEDGEALWKNSFNESDWSKIQEQMPSDIAQGLLEEIRNFNSWLLPETKKK